MTNTEDLAKQARAIALMGKKVLDTESTDHRQQSLVDETKFHDFRISGLSYLSRVFAERNEFYQSFKSEVTHPTASRTRRGIGILEASKKALEEGWLSNIRNEFGKEMLLDMLNIARAEASEKRVAAAVTTGCAILEKLLRDIAASHDVSLENKTREKTIPKRGAQLSGELYRKKLLTRQENKTILQQFELLTPNEDGSRRKIGLRDVDKFINSIQQLVAEPRS